MRKTYIKEVVKLLKIKGNVDLKELEKYDYNLENDRYKKHLNNNWWEIIIIDTKDREIYKWVEEIGYWSIYDVDKKDIDDLIKADLVEKVEVEK